MSRTLTGFATRLWSGFALFGLCALAVAQDASSEEDARAPRPQAGANVELKVDPQLMQLLQQWSASSARIQKLEGSHKRWVYDTVFGTERRSEGVFYYEAPDKGRIDLKPAKIGRDEVAQKQLPNGKPFTLKPDIAERWICNGREVRQINDEEKTVEVFPIPDQSQGANIMDGPLPFLFGMPPQKALARYDMKLLPRTNEHQVWLEVRPRWKQDAANWKQAEVILNRANFLPAAVRLIDPTGNTETVYTFMELEVNKDEPGIFEKLLSIGEKDPFDPKLAGYKANFMNIPPAEGAAPRQPAAPVLPTLANHRYLDAKRLLERAQCEVVLVPGNVAPQAELAHVVQAQEPAAGTPLTPKMKVTLTVYVAGNVMPDMSGYGWDDSEALLKAAGCDPKAVKGTPAPRPELVFTVESQQPAAGAPLRQGDKIQLKFFLKPVQAAATPMR